MFCNKDHYFVIIHSEHYPFYGKHIMFLSEKDSVLSIIRIIIIVNDIAQKPP